MSTSGFMRPPGVPYRFWIRTQAQNDAWTNDSLFVQFSGRVDANGSPVDRIGTTQAASIVLEEGNGAGVAGWGWNDDAYGTVAAPMYFAVSGPQTLRIQQREDGIMWDQIVISANTYRSTHPARPAMTASLSRRNSAPAGRCCDSHVSRGRHVSTRAERYGCRWPHRVGGDVSCGNGRWHVDAGARRTSVQYGFRDRAQHVAHDDRWEPLAEARGRLGGQRHGRGECGFPAAEAHHCVCQPGQLR